MSTNLQQYTIANIYVTTPDAGTKLLSEEASVTIDRSTGSQQVLTVQKGYSGESPGASMCELSVDNAVPSADFEFDPGPYMADLLPVKFTVFAAGRTLNFDGFIISDNFQHAVNSEAKLSFKARGNFGTWES